MSTIKTIKLQKCQTDYSITLPYDKIIDPGLALSYLKNNKENFKDENLLQRNKQLFIKNDNPRITSYLWFIKTINLLKTLLNDFENNNFSINTNDTNKIKQIINNFDLKYYMNYTNLIFKLCQSNVC